MKFIDIVNWC